MTNRPAALTPSTWLLWILPTILLSLAVSCGDETDAVDDRFNAVILSVDPSAGFAPAAISFVGELEVLDESVDTTGLLTNWDFGDGASTSGSFEVTHTFQNPGTYTVRFTIDETDDADAVVATAETTIDVVIHPPADLRASLPFVSEAAVRSQDDLRVTFDMFNDAAAVPVAFSVGVYLGVPDAVADGTGVDALEVAVLGGDAYLLQSQTFDSFEGEGATTNVDVAGIRVPAEVPSGTYEVFVFVDDQGIVGELNEDNNIQFASETLEFINTSSEGPDLMVTRVRARPSRTNALTAITLDIEISNVGTELAPSFDYQVFLSFTDSELDSSDTLVGTGSVTNMPANSEIDIDNEVFEFDDPVNALGNYFFLVVADSGEAVEEANESNNIGSSQAVEVTDQPIPGTDLIPTEFRFDPLTSFLDGSITLTASVINQGEEDAPRQFFCRVYLSEDDELDVIEDELLDSINFPILLAGEELEVDRVTRVPGFFDPGVYYVFTFCDPNFQIPEADEDNNILQADGRLEISTDPEIDIRFGTFDLQPRTVDNGEDLTVNMEICNDGNDGVGPSILRLSISADSQLDQNDSVLLQVTLGPIQADQCVTINTPVPAICDTFQPTYQVFAELDVTDLLPETNEDNNITQLDTPLTIEGIICNCTADPLEVNASGSNNSPATPTFVSPRTYPDLTMCDQAVDWYAVPLNAGETVRASIVFEHARGNLEMTLFAADRATVLDSSNSLGDREEVLAFVVPESGDYLLWVYGETEQDVNAYDLTIDISPPESGIDLIVTDVFLSDTNPVLGETIQVTFDIINLGDVEAGTNTARLYVSEDLEIDPATDLLLAEVTLDDVPAVGKRTRVVPVVMPAEGSGGGRYLGVVADALNEVSGELDETNNVGYSDLFELDAGCFDALEPNNSLDETSELTLASDVVTVTGMLVCSDNRDFFTICGEAGNFLEFTTQFNSETGDIDMRLYDEAENVIGLAQGTTGEERLEIDYLSADQCFTLEVLVVGNNREVAYDLVIETGAAPDELACSSAGEPNDGFSNAAPLGDFIATDVAVCPVVDIDYFRFNVSAGTFLEFTLEPLDGEDTVAEHLRMSLWSPSRTFLTNTVAASESLSYTTTSTGSHYLRVTSLIEGPRNQGYQISVEGLDGRDLAPDNFVIEPAVAERGDRVQYTFTILNNRVLDAAPFRYGIFLSDDPVISVDSDLLLEEVLVPGLAGSSSVDVGDKVTVPLDVAAGQLYFIGVVVDTLDEVDEFEENNNIAVLPLQILGECTQDAAEPNNQRVDAQPISDYTGEAGLTMCTDDEDWFTMDTSPGGNYTVEALFEAGEENNDLDIFVYDPADLDTPIGAGESIGSDELAAFVGPADTDFVYVVILPFGNTNVGYELVSPD